MLPLLHCFFCFYFFSVLMFFKPKLSYQYLFESLGNQQLGDILLNIYVFYLINFTKLCSLLATFVNTQKTFQSSLNVSVRVIWPRDIKQYQSNVAHFNVDINNVRQRRNNAVISSVEFHKVDQRRNNVESMTIFKKLKRAKYFWTSKKDDSLMNNTFFWLIKKKGKHGA